VADPQDRELRDAAFRYLDELRARSGGLVIRPDLEAFTYGGIRVPLISRQKGIWKPAHMSAALSILTVYARTPEARPYEDAPGPDGYLRYKWRGDDPNQADNVALRRAMQTQSPVIWFLGVAPGIFEPVYPVWLAAEEHEQQQFVVALDESSRAYWLPSLAGVSDVDPVRRYAEVLVRQRLHQPVFRDRVLLAYQTQCALCRLRHRPLLDAAHIKEDSEGGQPVVPNGLALCAIHHRAFDAHVLTVRPDYRVEVRADVLEETDGPTLTHALQGVHDSLILLPVKRNERPNRELLEERYQLFRAAG
jgi:putative restriction endonuclease